MPELNWVSDRIFTVSGFFSPEECRAYIEYAESMGFGDAPVITQRGVEMRTDIRNNTRVMVDDFGKGDELWRRAKPFIPAQWDGWHAIGVNERLRFYRYEVGQRFNWHVDGAFRRRNGETSKLTFMIYLNDGFEGGETAFDRTTIVPQAGMALFFAHELNHKGEIVIDGRKYVLRTDVMFRETPPTSD